MRLGAAGERSFTYDRAESAARAFFRQPGAEAALAWAADADLVYVSGITLAIFSAGERRRLADLAAQVRERGGAVAFDPNLRPALWPSILDAQAAILAFSRHIDIALPSLEDHAALFGPASAEVAARVWQATGATEVVVKAGAAGAFVLAGDQHAFAPAEAAARVIDTTGAGDAFNAAYLAARRLHGATIAACGARRRGAGGRGGGLARRDRALAGGASGRDSSLRGPAALPARRARRTCGWYAGVRLRLAVVEVFVLEPDIIRMLHRPPGGQRPGPRTWSIAPGVEDAPPEGRDRAGRWRFLPNRALTLDEVADLRWSSPPSGFA